MRLTIFHYQQTEQWGKQAVSMGSISLSVLLINTVVWRISENHNSVKIKKCVLARFSVYKSVIWNFYKNLYGLKYFSPARIFFPEFTTGKRNLISWYKIIASWQDSSLPHLNSLQKKRCFCMRLPVSCSQQIRLSPWLLSWLVHFPWRACEIQNSRIKYIYCYLTHMAISSKQLV